MVLSGVVARGLKVVNKSGRGPPWVVAEAWRGIWGGVLVADVVARPRIESVPHILEALEFVLTAFSSLGR